MSMSTDALPETPPGGGGVDPHELPGLDELRGSGVALAKSPALSSELQLCAAARRSAAVLESAAAAAAS